MTYVVYDTGALIAADKGNRQFIADHRVRLDVGMIPLLPSPVLAQAWTPGARNFALHKVVKGCRVVAFEERHARDVGAMCRTAGHSDVVDGFVALLAMHNGLAPIFTDDIDDITRLLDAAGVRAPNLVQRP